MPITGITIMLTSWDYVSDIIRHTYYNYMHSYASHIVLIHYILLTRLTALEASYSILLLNLHHII
jgi:hypothetical protein